MRLKLTPQAAAGLATMPPATKKRMKAILSSLPQDPSGRGLAHPVKRLNPPAPASAYRLALGDWRVVWVLRDRAIEVVRIFHRSEGYGWLERLYG